MPDLFLQLTMISGIVTMPMKILLKMDTKIILGEKYNIGYFSFVATTLANIELNIILDRAINFENLSQTLGYMALSEFLIQR
jgi:hypothetical protein